MKNTLLYYYNLEVNNVKKIGDEYHFIIDDISYVFVSIDRNEYELNELYSLINKLNYMNIPCHNIILNINNQILTPFNNKNYILLKKNIISDELITINDIIIFGNLTNFNWDYPLLKRINWKKMWSDKMDYFEYQLSQIGNKYPLLVQLFGYYEGFVEIGMQIFENHSNDYSNICISHKRLSINTTLSEFYNPLNFIIDYKIRDAAEYFKQKIFVNNNIYMEIEYYLDKIIKNNYDRILFLVRFFFPSFYFDMYENIINKNKKMTSLNYITLNYLKYEQNLKKIYAHIRTYINLPNIEWLTK